MTHAHPHGGDRRRRTRLLIGAVAAAAVAALLTVLLWPGGGDSGGTDTAATGSASARSAPTPSKSYPLSEPPRTIPAVREHEAARGPGWKPDGDGRVVVAKDDAKALADEGKLLAGELHLTYAEGAKPRSGDVVLAVTDAKGSGAKGSGPEAYELAVRDGQVRISGAAQAGVFYGTRTLKQIVRDDGTAPEGVVRDQPAKPQRGFMLDIARKHFTAGWIEERVRELADLKYNQLGLHFSDDQAFRIESSSHPEVVSQPHLTKAEVRRIVQLAQQLHITVIPEIDSPGHLGAVIKAHPDLQLKNASGVPARGAIDIANPDSAKIVDELLDEYTDLFPGAYWHLGSDEYQALMASNPGTSYPGLAQAAREKYGPDAGVQDLATGWLNDRADLMRSHDRKLKAWNDGFYRGGTVQAAKDIEVEYWTGKEIGAREPTEYLSADRDLVNLNDEYLYYVLGQPNDFTYPTGERIYRDWTPRVVRGTKPVDAKYDGQILGARFAVWCDLANSQTQDQIADGIRMPLRALAQKVWDSRQPALSWADFSKLARDLG
ncbi:beta-N-acetylglucosaminidase [Streptomyces triticagri]|uniref:Beta-N-acetylglucosaminidase n=1 Tax=Streptomyces triticagri TaxID=2293568 RepID=A0A372M969_9ACTN|nr:glycoside hydrolase family 20 protein [Streptomyces triticagri]RFU87466.1 beta-N-acetylglucosaminidase [Streptomyces triticagri]